MDDKFLKDLEQVQRQGAKVEFFYFNAIPSYIREENKDYVGKFVCVITLYMITRRFTFKGYGNNNWGAFYSVWEEFWKQIQADSD